MTERRYTLIEKYNPKTDLLTVTFRDNRVNKTLTSTKKLDGRNRKYVVGMLCERLGLSDLLFGEEVNSWRLPETK